MAASRYDKYVVRKPAIVTGDYQDEIPATDKIPVSSPADTGPRVIFSPDRVPEGNSIIEYGIISSDVTIGDGFITEPHKHDYEEIFLFLGTDREDTAYLGAEVEFWLGEGDARDSDVINTSTAIF